MKSFLVGFLSFIFILFISSFAILGTGCSNEDQNLTKNNNSNPSETIFTLVHHEHVAGRCFKIFVDKNTKIMYVSMGGDGDSFQIMVNEDGSPQKWKGNLN